MRALMLRFAAHPFALVAAAATCLGSGCGENTNDRGSAVAKQLGLESNPDASSGDAAPESVLDSAAADSGGADAGASDAGVTPIATIGGSWGASHLVTLDGLGYDFQQIGEFVLLSNNADVVVQTRAAAYYGSSALAGTQAVAANIAGDRVSYYYGAREPLLVNGVPSAIPAEGLLLANGGRVLRNTLGYELAWPSGERVLLTITGLINVRATVADRTQTYRGLLGTWDGDTHNDLVARDGNVLAWPYRASEVYGTFGDSWRVTPEESLFDYSAGQSTDTFSEDAFPSHIVSAQLLPTASFNQAHAACAAAGALDEAQLEGCMVDMMARGGNAEFAIASLRAAPRAALAGASFSDYAQDFENQDDALWTPATRTELPALEFVAPTHALGIAQSLQPVRFTLGQLPAHSAVSVAFDTNILGAWYGGTFLAAADETPFSIVTFSNTDLSQSFPSQVWDNAEHPAQSGALAVGLLGSDARALYHHSYTFAHTANTLTLSFLSVSLPGDAGFTLDNVTVTTGAVGDPWNPRCQPNAPALDDGNPCTSDRCDSDSNSVHEPRAQGASCPDADPCNGTEACDGAGQCVHAEPGADDGNPCTSDSCDPQLGVVHVPLASGSECGDGNRCNGTETCDGLGACRPGVVPEFPANDTSCDAFDDDCDGHVDEDYLPTTTHCGVGACANTGEQLCAQGAVSDTCQALAAASFDTSCDGIDDNCNGLLDEEYVPICQNGGVAACVSGAIAVASCDDGDQCTLDGCADGACLHGVANCDDGNPCTIDSCDPGLGCSHSANPGQSCSDANACTQADTCTASGVCQGVTVAVDDDNPCTDDACDPVSGAIGHVPAPGRACSDGNACTLGDSCDAAGSCQATSTRSCSDGVFCNGTETCLAASGCMAGTPPVIDDHIACTLDSCDEAHAMVVHQPPAGQAVCAAACVPATSTVTKPAVVSCSTPAGLGQTCSPAFTVPVTANCVTQIIASYTASSGHCSSVRIHFSVDGVEVATSAFVAAAVNTGPINLGTVPAGSHNIGFAAEIAAGGCGNTLGSWAGTVNVTTSPAP